MKKSTTAKKKVESKEFFTEKQLKEDPKLQGPAVKGEFVTDDGAWQGQTIEVNSDTKLEQDTGEGDPIILRSYVFKANPQTFKDFKDKHGTFPPAQAIFSSHQKGIEAMLWQDGLEPAQEIAPRVIIGKKGDEYLIMVGTRVRRGHTLLQKTKTLTEIINDTGTNTNKVPRSL